MAKVFPMKTNSEKNGKLPPFVPEGNFYGVYRPSDSPCSMYASNTTSKDLPEPNNDKWNGVNSSNINHNNGDGQHAFSSSNNNNRSDMESKPSSPPHRNPVLTEPSMSMHEIFASDDDTTGLLSATNSPNPRRPDDDDWFSGDGDFLNKVEPPENPRDRLCSTPPLSLHSGEQLKKQYEGASSPGDVGYGAGSKTHEKWSNESVASSGGNTPGSIFSADVSSSVATDAAPMGSVGSSINGSVPRGSGPRVNLYSAIGSLEHLTNASLKSLNNRLRTSTAKEFRGPVGDGSTLIPPANLWQGKKQPGSKDSRSTPQVSNQNNKSNRSAINDTFSKKNGKQVEQSKQEESKKENGMQKKQGSERKEVSGEPASDQRCSSKDKLTKPSALRRVSDKNNQSNGPDSNVKRVSINNEALDKKKKKRDRKPVEMFRPSCDAYTPRIEKKSIKYRKAEMREPVQTMASPMGTLQRPNFRDALRRVAMIIHQHIVKIETRFEATGNVDNGERGLFKTSMKEVFDEENYCTPTYKCTMVRIPMARPGMVYGLRKIKTKPMIPSEGEIYEFAHQLFKAVQLSSECSIVCLIYVERLMEIAKVPLLACTWRPIFMCGLLLASKVWQDLSSWNIEFAGVYPQYGLDAINKLEVNFLRNIKWDLYISSSLYAKYYFALRSIVEKVDFRQRYNRMVGRVDSVAQSEALKISQRSEQVKEEALLQLSRSM